MTRDFDLREFDEVFVTGTIASASSTPRVSKLRAVVATVSAERAAFKVWPADDKDSQLPPEHNGKLWFDWEGSEVELIARDA